VEAAARGPGGGGGLALGRSGDSGLAGPTVLAALWWPRSGGGGGGLTPGGSGGGDLAGPGSGVAAVTLWVDDLKGRSNCVGGEDDPVPVAATTHIGPSRSSLSVAM
jgi:hypothetical protein